jgi:hypothetical protein
MIKLIAFFLMISSSYVTFSQTLPLNSPERKQLIAMGYEFAKEDKDDSYSVASTGRVTIGVSLNNDRLAFTRFFTRERKLTRAEEFELMKILNTFNDKFSYQFSFDDEFIAASMYHFGSYDAKVLAKIVRMMEGVNSVFDSKPEIYKLVNK